MTVTLDRRPPLPALRLGRREARHPIVQGGMGVRISGANLAAAVANAGGVGTISAIALGLNSPHFDRDRRDPKRRDFFAANRRALADEVAKARSLAPDGVIAVNVMMAATDAEDLIQVAAEAGADALIVGAGLPLTLPELTREFPEVALVPVVSSWRAARLICRKWQRQYRRLPDGLVVECPAHAGGHLGAKLEELESEETALDRAIPEIVTGLRSEFDSDLPVLAAGGIWDRADIDRALALGAKGVQMGTRFIPTEECDADRRYKEFHLRARPEDAVVVPSPVGMPGRALRNAFVERAIAGDASLDRRCIASCLKQCRCRDAGEAYCILRALDRAAAGDIDNGLIFSGTNAGRAAAIVPVAAVMAELVGAAVE